jgi:hypothetical protein
MKALLLFVIACVSIHAQMTDEAGRKVAEAAVRNELHLRVEDPLQVRRADDLEEFLGIAVMKAHHFLFFRVSQAGTLVKEDGVETWLMVDADPLLVVAVGADRSTYIIHGLRDSPSEFDRLIYAAGITVRYREQVRAIWNLYREVDPRDYFEKLRPVQSLLDLKQTGERRCSYVDPNAFEKWWTSTRRKYDALSFQDTFVQEKERFSYGWIVLSSPDKQDCGGEPLRALLHLGLDGRVSEPTFSPIH